MVSTQNSLLDRSLEHDMISRGRARVMRARLARCLTRQHKFVVSAQTAAGLELHPLCFPGLDGESAALAILVQRPDTCLEISPDTAGGV